MSILQIFILSLIQGLTEFLPVSSSGHLIILPHFFGWANQGLEMDVAMHVGTLMAVLIYFWCDVWQMITHFFRYCFGGFRSEHFDHEVHLALSLVVATLPAVVVGFVLKRTGLNDFRQVSVIALTTIVFAVALFLTDHIGSKEKSLKEMSLAKGFIFGLGQAISLIPGVSRSGICISAGLLLGFTRVAAARFAFLMSIPSIIGAATLTGLDALDQNIPIVWTEIGLGIVFSALAGLAAIHFMLKFLNKHSLNLFVIYRILLGLTIWFIL